MKSSIFCGISQCSSVKVNRHFGGKKMPPKHPLTSVGLHVFISKKNEFFSRRELTGSGKQQHKRAASGQNSFWVAYEHTNTRLSVFPMSWQRWVRRHYNISLLLNGQNKRKYGVHPINQTCSSYGEFHHLYFHRPTLNPRYQTLRTKLCLTFATLVCRFCHDWKIKHDWR
jgi:hypothetical protein